MARLRPAPIAALARRLFRELSEKNAAFDLPARRFVRGEPDLDLSVPIGSRRAAIPFGPAAGPHTQLAQNIVLSWLAGGRLLELKTVQVDDALTIPRPCIDMREVGYNCEFSQELRAPESLAEYVKGALLIAVLAASGRAGVLPSFTATVFDASVGYDLAGIRSDKVTAYLHALRDVRPALTPLRAALRSALPAELRPLADVDVAPALVDTVTLSTFHGTPPGEIEAIADHLMTRHGLSVVVKLNPTLLGERDLRALLHDALGFSDVVVPVEAFARDPTQDKAFDMIRRLQARGATLGLRFGVKLTNTLVVENRRPFFPAAVKEAYLSGPPLHVLAMHLVARVRGALGMELPLSFSAGIDAHNVADAIALDLVPVTVCTDWLKTGGYGRGIRFHEALVERVRHAGATSRAAFILRAFGHEERALAALGLDAATAARALEALRSPAHDAAPDTPTGLSTVDLALERALGRDLALRWVREAARLNTATYAERVAADPATTAATTRSPRRSSARASPPSTASPATSAWPSAPTTPSSRTSPRTSRSPPSPSNPPPPASPPCAPAPSASTSATRSPASPTTATTAATATPSAPRTAAPSSPSPASSAPSRPCAPTPTARASSSFAPPAATAPTSAPPAARSPSRPPAPASSTPATASISPSTSRIPQPPSPAPRAPTSTSRSPASST